MTQPIRGLRRWHSLKSNPVTSATMSAWGKRFILPQVDIWVFCAATGRCGTNTLAEMMAAHADVRALHEPYPQPSDQILVACGNKETGPVTDYWRGEKLPRVLYAAKGYKCYLETTHLFMHTFADLALETFGERMKLIHLHRNVHQTARSFLGRGQDPQNDPWLIHPAAKTVVLDVAAEVAPGADFDDPFLRLVWYCHEVRARALKLAADNPQVELIDLPTESLNDPAEMTRVMQQIGLAPSAAVLEQCGRRDNTGRAKAKAPEEVDAGQLRAFEALLEQRLEQAGLSVSVSA